MILLAGSLVVAVLTTRQVEGSVPGKAAILGMAVVPDGFLIGTAGGAFSSRDGATWIRVKRFSGATLVANAAAGALALNGGRIYETADLESFSPRGKAVAGAVALAGNASGEIFLATGDGRFFRSGPGGTPVEIAARGGPPDVVTLAVFPGSNQLLAGGLSSGLWRSAGGGVVWTRVLGTPTRSALLDGRFPGRGLIATSGGVLVSQDGRQWSFTDLREPVEALSQSPTGYFALTASRLLYESADGLTWQARETAGGPS